MNRLRTAILLLLAFVAMLLAPVRTSWACPDGTPCVQDGGHGYVCAGGRCRSHGSCCKIDEPCHCKHGSLPGAERPRSTAPSVQGSDHCRFSVSGTPHLAALLNQAGKWFSLTLDALPAPAEIQLSLPTAEEIRAVAVTVGHRPPPLPSTGPSRAPPTA